MGNRKFQTWRNWNTREHSRGLLSILNKRCWLAMEGRLQRTRGAIAGEFPKGVTKRIVFVSYLKLFYPNGKMKKLFGDFDFLN